jgi:hypothetical protein
MVTVWTVVLVAACVAIAGLVLDGGALLRAQSATFDLAAEAARAGAQQLDPTELANGHVSVDPGAARRTVAAFLTARGATGEVSTDGNTITVTVHRRVSFQILHPGAVWVTETASAQAQEAGT